jgi:hypothetical protein
MDDRAALRGDTPRHIKRAIRRALAACLWLVLGPALLNAYLLNAQPARPTATLTGTVVDAETGTPLAGAHVFIASSLLGTATDGEGRYRLEQIPLGSHRIYVSMLGFEAATAPFSPRRDSLYTHDFELAFDVLELGGVTVTGEHDPRWKKRLRRFNTLFLGETENARRTEIINPEVLDFDVKWWGKFIATASAPLVIENRALGYRVTYFLKEFISEGSTIKYDGEPLFEALEPASPEEAEAWEERRRTAYAGSFRHFLLSLLGDSTEAAGFRTYRRFDLESPQHRHGFPIEPASLLQEGPSDQEKLLDFYNYIEVHFTQEQEDESFLRWQGRFSTARRGDQRSWIKLTNGPTVVDQNGEVIDPYGVTVYGYFAFERIADDVPKEYRPAPETLQHRATHN